MLKVFFVPDSQNVQIARKLGRKLLLRGIIYVCVQCVRNSTCADSIFNNCSRTLVSADSIFNNCARTLVSADSSL